MSSTLRGQKVRPWAYPALALVALWAVLLGPLASVAPAQADVTFDQQMLTLINQQRAAAGVAPVQASPALSTIAGPGPYQGCGFAIGGRAADMGARNYFSHTILNCSNQSVFNILSTSGLVYSAAGENIAWMNGTTDPAIAAQNLMSSLMASPEHKANILDPRFNQVGIGSWTTAPGQTWSGGGYALANVWVTTQVFAQMAVTAPPTTAPPTTAPPAATSPAASLSPTALGFGDHVVGTAAAIKTITVQNTGSGAMSIAGSSIAGANAADFSVASNGCGASLASGASCSIAVGFAPTVAGARSATLSVSDNAPGSPQVVTLTGNGTVAPAPPTNVVATGGDGQLTIRWAAPTTGAAPGGYSLFAYDAAGYAGTTASACATCTTATLTGLADGEQYYAAVYPYNGAGWGNPTNSNWASVLAVPGPVTAVQAGPGDGALNLTWRPPTTPNAAIDGYWVFIYDADGYAGKYMVTCATCTTATVTGLVNGHSYYATIYPHNANGWGTATTSGWVVVGSPGLSAHVVATGGPGSVSASWTPPPAGPVPIAGYAVFLYESGASPVQWVWACSTCTSTTFGSLPAGHTYTVMIQADNSFGWGGAVTSNPATTS